MSRAPPFPTRRRSPSVTNGPQYTSQPSSAPGTSNTRPLQVGRGGSRPTTPVGAPVYRPSSPAYDSPSYIPPNTAPLGPSRPQRSELRNRGEQSERTSTASQDPYNRDSIATSRSDIAGGYRTLPNSSNAVNGTPSRQRTLKSPASENGDRTTPTSLTSALSAFQSAGSRKRGESLDAEYQREREMELEAEKARQQRIRDRAPGMRSQGSRRRGEIDAVLDQVKDGWEFVIDPNFNNVDLALQLLDKSSLGKDMDSFRRTKNMLSRALKGSVDQHYQAFAASLPHHSSLLSHLSAAQTELSSARTSLLEAKESLGGKRADLVQLWNRAQILEEMIKLLDQIEHLKTVPDLLETLMSEKRLLQASVLLVRSLKIINKPDMLEIGAVSDLRSYLDAQEQALRDILVDELQSHLYLKSFWCESRWVAYVPNQKGFTIPEFEKEADGLQEKDVLGSPTSPTPRSSRLTRFLNNLSLRPNDPPHDLNENKFSQGVTPSISINGTGSAIYLSSSPNPEADSFAYMENLLESLAVLGKLGNALDTIAQRLSGEIFALVETTLDEVEERAEYGRRKSMLSLNGGLGRYEGVYLFSTGHPSSPIPATGLKAPLLKASTLRLSALESLAKRVDHEIIKDLFWTLYSKLDAVAQGLRVVTEVANRIGARRDYKDSSGAKPGQLFPLPEIWSHVQTEVRTLIRDYLVDERQGTTAKRNPISSINEVLREGRLNRDGIKPVFRFSDTDMKVANKALKPHEEGLTKVLKDTMPGLAPAATGDPNQTIITSGTDDRLLAADQHHRLVIRPDAFHVTVLFQPTLLFLQRVTEILPSGVQAGQTSSAILDEFVLNVYLPQLEEKVSDLFHNAITGPDAFQPDVVSLRLVQEPVSKASTNLMALINSLCAMLNTSPFHRENYARLILSVVIQFYQRCSDRFQYLTTSHGETGRESQAALAAQWAQTSELQTCFMELLSTDAKDRTKVEQLHKQEVRIELEFLASTILSKDHLISVKNLASLASLHRSVSWFAAELGALRARPEDVSLLSPTNVEPMTGMTPMMPVLPAEPIHDHLSLPLSREMSLRFQALLKTYEQLSNMILDTIRLDIRCRTIHYLDAAMRHGTYDSNYEAVEPDPHVVDLNVELVQCNEAMTDSLPLNERQYLFSGLNSLMEHMLISGARHLCRPNVFGIRKIKRNILALEQGVKTLVDDLQDAGFKRVKDYYSLFDLRPQGMIDGIRKHQAFTFDEYQIMLNLQCGVDPSVPEGPGKALDRNYSLYVIDLHGLDLDRMDTRQ